MKIKKPFHINDATIKYSSMAFRKRQHQFLKLPGKYVRRYPTEVVLPNMETGRMDELYSVSDNNEEMLIDLEEESEEVTDDTLKKFGKYKVFGSFIYGLSFLTAVICMKDPKDFPKEYHLSPTDIIRPIYIYFPEEELQEKYTNLINKINQNNILTDEDALSIAFIPKYISEEHAPNVCKSLASIFDDAIIPDKALKRDVGVILMVMILKHVKETEKQNELFRRMNMQEYIDEIHEIVYDEYGEELTKKDEKIKELHQELTKKDMELAKTDAELARTDAELARTDAELTKLKKEYKSKIDELNGMDDLNAPQAKKILNSILILLK